MGHPLESVLRKFYYVLVRGLGTTLGRLYCVQRHHLKRGLVRHVLEHTAISKKVALVIHDA